MRIAIDAGDLAFQQAQSDALKLIKMPSNEAQRM
jgi:hypothetical protein